MKKFSFIILLTLILVSCSEMKMLQETFQKLNSSIDYTYDSKNSSCPRSKLVYIDIKNSVLDSMTTVTKTGSRVLPLLFYNEIENTIKLKLGQGSIKEDYSSFIKNTFVKETNRSACFSVTDTNSNDSTYSLYIKIDSCNTISSYKRTTKIVFLLFAYSIHIVMDGLPAETNLQYTATFKKGKDLIFEKKYIINQQQPFIYSTMDNYNADFISHMTAALSVSTKMAIEQIIADINTSLFGSSNPQMQINEKPVLFIKDRFTNRIDTKGKISQDKTNDKNSDLLAVGDKVSFYNFGLNSNITGTIKSINNNTITVEYVSFEKNKVIELSKADVKKVK